MPAEILDHIASNLRGSDTVAMAISHPRAIGGRVKSHVDRARTTHEASEVSTLVGFQATLAAIGNIPRLEHQAEPLFQLGLRVHALPQNDKSQATAAFQIAVSAVSKEHRVPELERLARVVGYDNPKAAVRAGESVLVAAQAWSITTPEGIHLLEVMAIQSDAPTSADGLVGAGGNVQDVARDKGITTPEGIHLLEVMAIQSDAPTSAGSLVRAGGNVQDVARDKGITTPEGIHRLEVMAIQSDAPTSARSLVRTGGNVQDVARDKGITTPEGIHRLEVMAIQSDAPTSAGSLVRTGGNVQDVARDKGITTTENIHRLERIAANR